MQDAEEERQKLHRMTGERDTIVLQRGALCSKMAKNVRRAISKQPHGGQVVSVTYGGAGAGSAKKSRSKLSVGAEGGGADWTLAAAAAFAAFSCKEFLMASWRYISSSSGLWGASMEAIPADVALRELLLAGL